MGFFLDSKLRIRFGISFTLVFLLMIVLTGQLIHKNDVKRYIPMLKAIEVSDFCLANTKIDCSGPK